MPADYKANRYYWSTREPWRLVQYKLTIRLVEPELAIGVDLGVNLTVDHSKSDVDAKMRTLRHFQLHSTLPPEPVVLAQPTVRTKRKRRVPELIDETDNQDLLPPDLEEAILKELSHDILEGISVQDIFQDISEREDMEDEWAVRPRKTATLRSGNWNPKPDKSGWKRKAQEGKENKMVGWCARLLQVCFFSSNYHIKYEVIFFRLTERLIRVAEAKRVSPQVGRWTCQRIFHSWTALRTRITNHVMGSQMRRNRQWSAENAIVPTERSVVMSVTSKAVAMIYCCRAVKTMKRCRWLQQHPCRLPLLLRFSRLFSRGPIPGNVKQLGLYYLL